MISPSSSSSVYSPSGRSPSGRMQRRVAVFWGYSREGLDNPEVFASVFTANYLMGEGVHKSCLSAAKFVTDSIKITDGEHFYGVNFEKILKKS